MITRMDRDIGRLMQALTDRHWRKKRSSSYIGQWAH